MVAMLRIYWTGVKMGTPAAMVAIFYLYVMIRLPADEIWRISVVVLLSLLIEYTVKWAIQLRLSRQIRKFGKMLEKGREPSPELIQAVWVETMNLPLWIVGIITFGLSMIIVVMPTTFYALYVLENGYLARHIFIAGFLAISLLSMINLLLYERALAPLLIEIEKLGQDQINRNDRGLIFISMQVKLIFFFGVVVCILALLLNVLFYEKVAFLTNRPLEPDQIMGLLRWQMAGFSVFVIGLTTFMVHLLVRHQAGPIERVRRFMERVVRGEMNRPFYASMGGVVRDEGNLLAEVFTDMTAELGQVLSRVRHTALQFQREASRLDIEAADHDQVITEQMEQAQRLRRAMASLETQCGVVSTQGDDIFQVLDETLNDVTTGHDMIQKVVEGIDILKEEANATQDQVEVLYSKLGEIHEITSIIRTVTNQTLVIGFNAFLEAADEEERLRFNDIAESINTLTGQITESAQRIRAVIHDVQHYARMILTLAELEFRLIDQESTATTHIYGLIKNIANSIRLINQTVKQITEAIHRQDVARKELQSGLDHVIEIIEHTADNSQQALETLEELRGLIQGFHGTLNTFFPMTEK